MDEISAWERRRDLLAGAVLAVLGIAVTIVGAAGTVYSLVNIGHHPAPLPDEPPPDFQTAYAIALSFAAIALLGVTVVAIGIMVARRHQFARLVGILVCVGGLGFALWLGAHSLRVTTFVGPERVPLYDARAMLGALLVGIPLAIAAICLLKNVVREGNTRR